MPIAPRWFRPLVIAGLTAMMLGVVDPMEGSLVIAVGSVLVALATPLAGACGWPAF